MASVPHHGRASDEVWQLSHFCSRRPNVRGCLPRLNSSSHFRIAARLFARSITPFRPPTSLPKRWLNDMYPFIATQIQTLVGGIHRTWA